MGRKCSVPLCKSNYDNSEKISTFCFPSDPELRNKWLSNIKRKDFVITKNSSVCIKHFSNSDLITETETSRGDRKKQRKINLQRPKPHPSAVPTVFPDYPQHSQPSSTPSTSRLVNYSELKINKAIQENTILLSTFEENDILTEDFNFSSLSLPIPESQTLWIYYTNCDTFYISQIDHTFSPKVLRSCVLKWNNELSGYCVELYFGNITVSSRKYHHLLHQGVIKRESALINLITLLKNYSSVNDDPIHDVKETIRKCSDRLSENSQLSTCSLTFLAEQLELWGKAPSHRR